MRNFYTSDGNYYRQLRPRYIKVKIMRDKIDTDYLGKYLGRETWRRKWIENYGLPDKRNKEETQNKNKKLRGENE